MKISYNTISALQGIITGNNSIAPYRTMHQIAEFFSEILGEQIYGGGSRWSFAEGMLKNLNGTPKMKEVIKLALDPRRFAENGLDINEAVKHLNNMLLYDGYKIVQNGLFFECIEAAEEDEGRAVKNLIFASIGPKPEIVLDDATTNDIKIVKNAEYCLIYDKGFSGDGLLWGKLVDWWCEVKNISNLTRSEQRKSLFVRLKESLGDNKPEILLFTTYYKIFFPKLDDKLPALIPQVYLHYDPYTVRQLGGVKRLARERMDFLLLLPKGRNIVIEIDGKHHYSKDDIADTKLYATMVSEDRKLKLKGYELYRFGGYEFSDCSEAELMIQEFFEELFKLHSIWPES